MKINVIKLFYVLFILGGALITFGQTIVNTKHNLSVSGPGTVKASSETQICIFCHTPHNSSPVAPLWNRQNSGTTYVLYASSTLNATLGQPDGASMLCLSCHDGTIGLGNIMSGPQISFLGVTGVAYMPSGVKNLTNNLSNDHPISFIYNSTLATNDGQLKNPAAITPPVKLDPSSKVQCTSCHDPHENIYTNFLVTTSQASNLCNSCHNRTNWTASSHNTSTHTWNGVAPNPWFHTPYTTVAANACENCHNPHTAGGSARLLKYSIEENNCLDCHNGNAATKDIQTQVLKTYRHNVYGYTGLHDPTETAATMSQHVECTDCHNPHAANSTTASAPFVRGTEIGVSGINQSGTPVTVATNSYEICYKCHAGNSWAPSSSTARVISQNNVRLEFDTGNPSFHPVAGPRNSPDIVQSHLVSPNTPTTVLYCTSCHSNNDTSLGSVKGPHGSTYPQLLKLQYEKNDGSNSSSQTIESAQNYALCYSCHNRTSVILNSDNSNSNTFRYHNKHVVEERTPCNTCHDPHGISSLVPNSSTNNTHLINFRSGIVTPSSSGLLKYVDSTGYHGKCYLTCHGTNHNPRTY